MNRDRILARIRELRPWYHNVPLGEGITTKDLFDPNNFHVGEDVPTMLWKHIEPFFPSDLRGKRALDIGCNARGSAFGSRAFTSPQSEPAPKHAGRDAGAGEPSF